MFRYIFHCVARILSLSHSLGCMGPFIISHCLFPCRADGDQAHGAQQALPSKVRIRTHTCMHCLSSSTTFSRIFLQYLLLPGLPMSFHLATHCPSLMLTHYPHPSLFLALTDWVPFCLKAPLKSLSFSFSLMLTHYPQPPRVRLLTPSDLVGNVSFLD